MSLEQTAGGLAVSMTAGFLATTTQPVLGMNPSIALAGVFGSIMCILLQKDLTTRETLAIMFCGTLASVYGTSLVAGWVGVSGDEWLRMVGLLLGMAGIYLFRRILDIVQDPAHVVEAIKGGKFLDLLKVRTRTEQLPPPSI